LVTILTKEGIVTTWENNSNMAINKRTAVASHGDDGQRSGRKIKRQIRVKAT
jgi:hypothetical protein